MFKRTRALWIELETKARLIGAANKPNKAFIRECEQFWNRLDATKRSTFVTAYEAYKDLEEEYADTSEIAVDARDEADAIARTAATDWEDYVEKYDRVARKWREAAEVHKELREALRTLSRAVHSFHHGTDDPTPAHDNVLAWFHTEALNQDHVRRGIVQNTDSAQRLANSPPIPVQRPDGRNKVDEGWVTDAAEKECNVRRQRVFQSSGPGHGMQTDGWVGGWMFNEGAMANAGLWVLLHDDTDLVLDRVVRKDTFWDRSHWAHIQRWWGDIRNPDARVLYELKCHQTLDGAQSNLQEQNSEFLRINVPHLRAHHTDDAEMMLSLTMEYCPLKSLDRLIAKHKEHNEQHPNDKRKLPEPFCWRLFHSLAEVGMAMEKGHAKPDDLPIEGHQQIIHRDLKPPNIFLSLPTSHYFDSYPTPYCSDFGLSFMTTEDDPLNPDTYVNGGGTTGFLAPETHTYVSVPDLRPIDRFKMLAHTNVWGVGMIMFCTIALELRPDVLQFIGNGEEPGDFHDVMAIRGYSRQLRELIRDCLRFHPDNRPTWDEVLERIDEAMNEAGLHLCKDLRTTAAVGEDHPEFLHHVPKDDYALGLSLLKLPRLERV